MNTKGAQVTQDTEDTVMNTVHTVTGIIVYGKYRGYQRYSVYMENRKKEDTEYIWDTLNTADTGVPIQDTRETVYLKG